MNLLVFEEGEWGRPLSLDDERAIHIREVLRPKPGQKLKVALLGRGRGEAVYRDSAGGAVTLDFPSADGLSPGQGLLPITLLLGHPRPPVMQRLLKDLNAAGVARIFAVASELAEKSYMQSRLWQSESGTGQYRRFLVQGAQQGGQVHLSAVRRFYSLHKGIAACHPQLLGSDDGLENGAVWETEMAGLGQTAPAESDQIRLFCDIAPGVPSLLELASDLSRDWRAKACWPKDGIAMAIGPERGWSTREREMLREAAFVACGLGDSIVRTETACNLSVGVLAMAMAHAG